MYQQSIGKLNPSVNKNALVAWRAIASKNYYNTLYHSILLLFLIFKTKGDVVLVSKCH